jgi:hypothetical protein
MITVLRKIFTSLWLAIICLALGMIVIFVGTLDQVNLGIHAAQKKYFESWFVYWTIPGVEFSIPVLPGGFLLSLVLLINLISAHLYRFEISRKKIGIFTIHAGIIIILVGQLVTSIFSVESQMRIDEGSTANFSENIRITELVIVDTSDPKMDKVVAIPESMLSPGSPIEHPSLPFKLVVKRYFPNSDLSGRSDSTAALANEGLGTNLEVKPLPITYKETERNLNTTIVEFVSPNGSLGSWLYSTALNVAQPLTFQDKTFQIQLRPKRYYRPYSIELLDFTHEKYAGTEVPKHFSSKVRLKDPSHHENREVLIYMNNPLRHQGETFYQAGFESDDRTTILQVVKNPGWVVPYVSCSLIALGLIWQFSVHLVSFLQRRKA